LDNIICGEEEIRSLSRKFALPDTTSVLGMRELIDNERYVENLKLKLSGETLTTSVKGSVTSLRN
jgi:hypothetical protein